MFHCNIEKVFDFIGNVAKTIADPEGAAQEAVDARDQAFREGNIGAAVGYDAKALLANTVSGVKKNLGFALNPEERMRQQLEQKEPFLKDMLRKKGQQFTKEQWGWLEQLGYVKGGQLTEKAQALAESMTTTLT